MLNFHLVLQKIKQCRGEDSLEFKIASDAMLAVWKGLLNATKGLDLAAVPFPFLTLLPSVVEEEGLGRRRRRTRR